jgi:hypothetical protein
MALDLPSGSDTMTLNFAMFEINLSLSKLQLGISEDNQPFIKYSHNKTHEPEGASHVE